MGHTGTVEMRYQFIVGLFVFQMNFTWLCYLCVCTCIAGLVFAVRQCPKSAWQQSYW